MSFVDDLIDRYNDLDRRLGRLERLDVNPPASFGAVYSGTPVANAIAYWAGAGTVAGTRPVYVNSGGSVGINTSAPESQLHVNSESNSSNRGLILDQHNAGAQGALLIARKSRGTLASPSVITNGDFGAAFFYQFYDGTAYLTTAAIAARSNGAVSAGTVPTDLIFGVGSTDNVSLTNEVMRLAGATGYTGINQSAPAAQLDVLQATLGSPVQRLASTATNNDPTEDVMQNRVATTNATVTTLHTFTVPASTTYMIIAYVVARRTGGSGGTAEDGAAYQLQAAYKNVAGAATFIPGSSITTLIGESVAGYDATLDTTGATVRVRVTGVLNTNITWHMTARIYAVST